MKNVLFVMILLFLNSTLAEVRGSNSTTTSVQSATPLPNCVNSADEIATIKVKIKANTKTSNKYDGYKKALASDSEIELMARLVYAETKATQCEKQNNEIVPIITEVIANRVKIRKGDVKSVVFQRDQFSSSLNIYEESNYKDFLCPNDEILWQKAYSETFSALADKTKGSDTVNYFLYKHSPRWTKEPWNLEEDQVLTKANIKSCIRAFKNPNFK